MKKEFSTRLNEIGVNVENLKKKLDIESKKKRLEELQLKMSSPNFWNNREEALQVVEELKILKEDIDDWCSIKEKYDELQEWVEIVDEQTPLDDLEKELVSLESALEKFQLQKMFSGRFDSSNAIVEINAGAGGTESCDWVNMLFRMYTRWAEDKRFNVNIIDELKGDEAGIKNITFIVEGRNAYGMLKAEKGVHRLVRISPFDANRRRHTSFASVNVLPEIVDDDIIIAPEELRIETFRASGRGGQHVNVTDSAVRITHLPTGIVVSCQNERSQYQNKQAALKVLKAKLYELKEEQKKKELESIGGEKRKIEWGSQIRSYVLHPYLLVKDHRTQYETSDAYGVLDGNIDGFIKAYLIQKEVYDD